MSQESTSMNADRLGDVLECIEQPFLNRAAEMNHAICNEAKHLSALASERIRQNPLPIVAGAAAFGIAIGYLVAGRNTPSFQETYVSEPLEQINDTLGSLFSRLSGNLKFW